MASVDHLNASFPPGWAGPESGFASERSPSNIASQSAGHSSAGDGGGDACCGGGGGRGGSVGGGSSNRSSRLESACGDSLSSCDILPFSEDEYEKIQDNSSSEVNAATANSSSAVTAGMTDHPVPDAAVSQRPAECGRAAADASKADMARQIDRWRQDASLRHDLCSRSDSRLRNGFVACRVRSHDTVLRRVRISASAESNAKPGTDSADETLLMLLTREEGDRLEFLGGIGDRDGQGEGYDNIDEFSDVQETCQPASRSLAEVQVRHSRSAYLSTASNYFYGMTAVDNDVVHDDIDGEGDGEVNAANQSVPDASVSAANDCHWNGDGISDMDLSALSQQGGSCPIRLALAQARIAASGSVSSSGDGRRRREFRSDTRLHWMSMAGGSEAFGDASCSGDFSAGPGSGGGGYGGGGVRDATSSDVESWSFSRSELSSSAGSYALELEGGHHRGGRGGGISCDSLDGEGHRHLRRTADQASVSSSSNRGRHQHLNGADEEAAKPAHSLRLCESADRHQYQQYRCPSVEPDQDPAEAAASATSATINVSEEDQSGLDDSSRSSMANEQLDLDQLWDNYAPHLYSDAEDGDVDSQAEAEAVLDDSQLLWEIDQLDGGGLQLPAGLLPRRQNLAAAAELHREQKSFRMLQHSTTVTEVFDSSLMSCQLPNVTTDADADDADDKDDVIIFNSAEWRRCAEMKAAAEMAHSRYLAADEFDASAADIAAGIDRLDQIVEDLRSWLVTAAAETGELQQSGGGGRKLHLLTENWLTNWLQADLESCLSKRQSLHLAYVAMLELEQLLSRCERLINEGLHRLRCIKASAEIADSNVDLADARPQSTVAKDLAEASRNAESATALAARCAVVFNAGDAAAHLTASAHAQTDARIADAVTKSARLRRRCDRLVLLLTATCLEPSAGTSAASRNHLRHHRYRSMAALAAVTCLSLLLLLLLWWLLILLTYPTGPPPQAALTPAQADWSCRRGWADWLMSRLFPVLSVTRPNGAPV